MAGTWGSRVIGHLPSKCTNLQDLLRADGTCEEVQEFPLGRAYCDIPQRVRLAIFHDLVEHFVPRDQERVVINIGLGPNLLRLWEGHDSNRFLERWWWLEGQIRWLTA